MITSLIEQIIEKMKTERKYLNWHEYRMLALSLDGYLRVLDATVQEFYEIYKILHEETQIIYQLVKKHLENHDYKNYKFLYQTHLTLFTVTNTLEKSMNRLETEVECDD